jgi:hypothetical protein
MIPSPRALVPCPRRPRRAAAAALLVSLFAGACGGTALLPPPRPLVVTSGARLNADPERLQETHDWMVPQIESIQEDPSFWLIGIRSEEDTYPWETLVINERADTVRYQYVRSNPDIDTPYSLYAHFHLMHRTGRLEPWLPEAASAEGYALERAIVARMADSWLLGRAIFDAQPHQRMDALIYAKEAGHLDAFLFTARPDEFQEAREVWLRQNPRGLEEYQAWFRQTLGGDPPGVGTRGRS